MAKSTTSRDFQSTVPPKVKYYFTKQKLETGNFLSESLFQNPDFVGVILKPVKHYQGKINLFMNRFMVRTTLEETKLTAGPDERYATIESPFQPSKVSKIDFFFLDKTQLRWLMGQMGSQDKLCFADAYIDMGLTPPVLNEGGKKYLTLKAWIEKPDQANFIAMTAKEKIYPSFSVLVPCPPIWPPNNTEAPRQFRSG